MIQPEPISVLIGFVGALIIVLVGSLIWNAISFNKRHSLREMRILIQNTHQCLKEAAEHQKNLYTIINEVEETLG